MLSVSIICATIDSSELVTRSLQSIYRSCCGCCISIQVIIINQNNSSRCNFELIECDNFSVIVIDSNKRGLSLNRNIGLRRATGDWVMFWDADCLMDFKFFKNFLFLVDENKGVNIFFGKINSIEHDKPIFRSWPRFSKNVTRFYVWQLATSVNGIWRRNSFLSGMSFDENFGLGAIYGSCEDVDFYVNLKQSAYYSPNLITYHPHQDVGSVNFDKVISYSYGFGALCRKHVFHYGLIYFFLSALRKFMSLFVMKISIIDFSSVLKARFSGFFDFKG